MFSFWAWRVYQVYINCDDYGLYLEQFQTPSLDAYEYSAERASITGIDDLQAYYLSHTMEEDRFRSSLYFVDSDW